MWTETVENTAFFHSGISKQEELIQNHAECISATQKGSNVVERDIARRVFVLPEQKSAYHTISCLERLQASKPPASMRIPQQVVFQRHPSTDLWQIKTMYVRDQRIQPFVCSSNCTATWLTNKTLITIKKYVLCPILFLGFSFMQSLEMSSHVSFI